MNPETFTMIIMLALAGTGFAASNINADWYDEPVGNLSIDDSLIDDIRDYFDEDDLAKISKEDSLKKFDSPDELKKFLEKKIMKRSRGGRYGGVFDRVMVLAEASAGTSMAPVPGTVAPAMTAAPSLDMKTGGASDYSTTNVQVKGVDEADIVKNDGRYIYVLRGKKVTIVDAYPPESADVLSTINVKGSPSSIYINGDKLIVLGNDYVYTETEPSKPRASVAPYRRERGYQKAVIYIYDITDRKTPQLEREVHADGNYLNSRMIGDHVYMIATQHMYYYNDDIEMPRLTGTDMETETLDVYYFDDEDSSYSFTTVVSVDVQKKDEDAKGKVYLTGATGNIFVSQNNIYVTYSGSATTIHKIAIDDGDIFYVATGEVPGSVLNQFSMDEHDGYFRIATTTGQVSRWGGRSSANNVYVLDADLKIVGELEDLAPGERIYSARFMGERAYLVTFKKVDPLFVIDLEDPENPEVLGKLKIPGYSDYLHPYDENHIIGLGKDTVEANSGDFAWYQGIKLALFDVTDVENPKEVSKFIIGDRGTDSYALRDHKAFLFSREHNMLVIPVLLAKINEDRYYGEVRKNTHGEHVWQGAYVFNIDQENGIGLKGTISHASEVNSYERSRWFYQNSEYAIKRSLYMDNVLYTISDGMIKMNDMDYLYEINLLRLGS